MINEPSSASETSGVYDLAGKLVSEAQDVIQSLSESMSLGPGSWLLGLLCAVVGALIAVALKKRISGSDMSSAKLKEKTTNVLKEIILALKDKYQGESSRPKLAYLAKIAGFAKEKRELMVEKKKKEEEGGASAEIDSKIKRLEEKMNKMISARPDTYFREKCIAGVLRGRKESVSALLAGDLVFADLKGREKELGIQEVEGQRYLSFEHILHKGKFHIQGSDEMNFELRLIPSLGSVIDLRERKLDDRKESPLMRYKIKLTAFLPLRFPRHLRTRGRAVLKKCNKKYEAVTEASIHYIDTKTDRDKVLRGLRSGCEEAFSFLRSKEKYEDFFFVENWSTKGLFFDSSFDVISVVSSEKGATRLDMYDGSGEAYYFETELHKPISRLCKVLTEFICPLLVY